MGNIQIVSGKVVKGNGLGLKISFPTINIVVDKNEEQRGVYACRVRIVDAEFFGAGYIGEKKGLPQGKFICEVFLFGDIGDVYGKAAEIELLQKIRDVQKVKSLEELKSLIASDVECAKEYIKNRN